MKALSFDDISLVPRYNNIASRKDVDTSVQFGKLKLDIPIFSSNMDTVTGPEMAVTITQSVNNFGDRLVAKPGITGLAQVNYKYGSDIRDARNKLRLDTIYIEKASPLLDAKIILLTFRRVFLTRGT